MYKNFFDLAAATRANFLPNAHGSSSDAIGHSVFTKRIFFASTSAAAMVMAGAFATSNPTYAQDNQSAAEVEQIVVTGSRIVRDGY